MLGAVWGKRDDRAKKEKAVAQTSLPLEDEVIE